MDPRSPAPDGPAAASPAEPAEIPLVAAAARLRLTYHRAFNAVLSGRLEGRQDERGRWLVSRSACDRFARERETAAAPTTSAA